MSSVTNNGATNSATPPFTQNLGAGTPTNGYVAEDDTTFYVAEDDVTFYVQEI